MKYLVFALKDVKVEFMSPFVKQNQAQAIRDFAQAVRDKEPNILNKTPEDIELWSLGEYDSVTGLILPNKDGSKFVVKALDYVIKDVV